MNSTNSVFPGMPRRYVAVILAAAMFVFCMASVISWLVLFRVEFRMSVEQIRSDTGLYDAGMQWRRRGLGQWELVHGFIFNNRTSGSFFADCGSGPRRSGSRTFDDVAEVQVSVRMTPDGLVADGVPLFTTSDARIVVLAGLGNSIPVSLTPDELSLFHPDVYPRCLTQTDFWKSKFKPLVDPEAVAREKRIAERESGKAQADLIKSFGIDWHFVFTRTSSGVRYYAQFYTYPNGSSHLLNMFFSASQEFHVIHSNADVQKDPAALYILEEILGGEIPLRYSLNDQRMEPGQIYILHEDNTFKPIELTPEEYRQCTIDSFRNARNLEATDLYRKKIAPALGVAVEAE